VVTLCFVVFVVSGFAGLVYESVWAQYLKLFLGHAAYAQTVVLVVFMGGMAIGAALIGQFTNRLSQPLVVYAAVELALGVAGVVFHDVYRSATDWGYAWLMPRACSPDGPCAAGFVLGSLLLLPQSVLLGATFPLMVAGVLRREPQAPGRTVAMLYFCNSIGAVIGVLASTFWLIPAVGLPGTSRAAGVCNLAIGVVILAVSVKASTRAAISGPGAAASAFDRGVTLLLVVSALTGLSSFIYEIVWIRMLSLVLGASTHAFELMLASFILGLALGGLWIRSRIERVPDAWTWLAQVQICMGVLALATLPLYNQLFDLAGYVISSLKRSADTYPIYHAWSAAASMVVMLPATFCAGMTLPLITLLLIRSRVGERGVGFCYAANTVGAIVGVILCVHLLMPLSGLRVSLLVGCAIDIALGVWLLVRTPHAHARPWRGRMLAMAAVVTLAAVALGSSFDPARTSSGVFRDGSSRIADVFKVIYHRDGKTSTVDVLQSSWGYTAIKTNGKTDASIQTQDPDPTYDEHTMIMSGALPLAYRPDARNVAVIGFGSGLTTTTLLESKALASVETIEIEPSMVEGAKAFRPVVELAYTDPRSHLIFDDAKAHFARAGRTYDVVVAEPSNPWVSGVASLFTEEFYHRVRDYLTPRGILVQWVQMYEFNPKLLGSVLQAVGSGFEHYTVYRTKGNDLIIVAAKTGRLPEPSDHMFAEPGVAKRLARIGIHDLADLEARRVGGRALLEPVLAAQGVPVNSDFYPYVDLNAPRARFAGSTAGAIAEIIDGPTPLAEMLERRRPIDSKRVSDVDWPDSRQQRIVLSEYWADYLIKAAALSSERSSTDTEKLPHWIAATRSVLIDCAPDNVAATFWDQIVKVAGFVNPSLPPERAEELWTTLAGTRCAALLPARNRQWLDLFKAVARRDAPQMAEGAKQLLRASGLSEAQRDYVYNVALAGLIADGRYGEAKVVLEDARSKLDEDDFSEAWMVMAQAWVGQHEPGRQLNARR